MPVQWGKLVSKLTDERDKHIHLRKAKRMIETIKACNTQSISDNVLHVVLTFLENYFKYPELERLFPDIDAREVLDAYLHHRTIYSIASIIEKTLGCSPSVYEESHEISIPIFIPDKNKYGGVDLFVWDVDGLLIEIPSVYARIVLGEQFTVEAQTEGVHETREFKYLDEVIEYLRDLKESVQKAVNYAVSNLPEHPVKIPEKLITYLKTSVGDMKVIRTYDLHFRSFSECDITPSSVLLKHPYFEISRDGRLSWYPEDAIVKVIEGFAKLYKDYVLLHGNYMNEDNLEQFMKAFKHYWVHNEEYGFWRRRFDHYYDEEGEKVYRMSDKYTPEYLYKCKVMLYGHPYCLFKIVKVTKKSAWLVPVEDPVSLVLKDIGLEEE